MIKNPLSVLSPEEQAALLSKAKILRFRKGAPLFVAGEAVRGLFHLRTGVVKVTQAPGKSTKAVTVRIVGPESWIGHRSVFTSETYRGSAHAKEKCETYFIPIEVIRDLFAKDTEFAYQMIRLIIQDLERSESLIFDTQRLNLPSRILAVLKSLALSFGTESVGVNMKGTQLNIKISRVELSEMVGSSPEAVSRQFSVWKKQQLVKDLKNGLFLSEKLLSRVTRK